MSKKYCDFCHDGNGRSAFPYYGLAPHKHNFEITGCVIGSTEICDKSEYPDNFEEDSECEGMGTYTNCPECGAGL